MTLLRLLARNVALLWILVGALIVLLGVAWLHRPPVPLVSPKLQQAYDSLKRTKQEDDSTIVALRAWADTSKAMSDSAAGRARVYEGASQRIGGRADTYANEARRTDPTGKPHSVEHADSTAALWKAAYEERTYERDTLKLALKAEQKATHDAQVAAETFRRALDDSEKRRKAVEDVNDGLADAVRRANKGCRVLWMSCPSRTETLAAGVIIGAVGLATLSR